MFNDAGYINADSGPQPRHPAVRRPRARSQPPHESVVKSATRALEIIELFAVHRHPLSVTEIANALAIPQSSSSVLLQAMNRAGFIDRDRQTRKYLPSVRSVFLGNWIHDTLFRRGSLLRALDTLSETTGANVRLGVRNGIHVQYVHVSWPTGNPDEAGLHPGMTVPICHDALGVMLLASENDRDIRGIVRHANAVAGGTGAVNVAAFLDDLQRDRGCGFAEREDQCVPGDQVLAVRLPMQLGVSAAIGLGVAAGRLPGERAGLLRLLDVVVKDAWGA
ncbi:MAG TPA: helix-turn-helix domain-containing protein [Bauldia sp.]|nr:helix-turn-helix domain-containing protein [Bauldia sp.]